MWNAVLRGQCSRRCATSALVGAKGGHPVDFDYVTDSKIEVLAKCILGVLKDNKYYYWEELTDFKLPVAVDNEFNGFI